MKPCEGAEVFQLRRKRTARRHRQRAGAATGRAHIWPPDVMPAGYRSSPGWRGGRHNGRELNQWLASYSAMMVAGMRPRSLTL